VADLLFLEQLRLDRARDDDDRLLPEPTLPECSVQRIYRQGEHHEHTLFPLPRRFLRVEVESQTHRSNPIFVDLRSDPGLPIPVTMRPRDDGPQVSWATSLQRVRRRADDLRIEIPSNGESSYELSIPFVSGAVEYTFAEGIEAAAEGDGDGP
jgi:hypothetical protein